MFKESLMRARLCWSLTLLFGCATAFAADGAKPDFTGVWQVAATAPSLRPAGGGEPPLLPEAKKLHDQNKALLAKGDKSFDPTQKCKPPGNPRTMIEAMPFEITQRPDLVFFGYQWNRLNRFVYWSDTLPESPGWTYYGDSVAAWDGNTLVIRSHGYQDTGTTYLDSTGLPHSDQLELTERYSLKNGGKQMELRLTIADSKTYSKPWDAVVTFNKKDGVRIADDICVLRMNLIKTNK